LSFDFSAMGGLLTDTCEAPAMHNRDANNILGQ
jgi:hypothetical protein